jgi:8-oxo-dGTP pyrophosphatase MutT (NUDIX family)
MKLLGQIARQPNIPAAGRTLYRTAVRGIVLDGRRLLMVYSPVNGDYKFPGGGVKAREELTAALEREIQEECGVQVLHIGPDFGQVIERDLAEEPDYDIFQMTSSYYLCQVADHQQPQRLDDYEAELEFQPVWVDIDEAIRVNTAVLQSDRQDIPFWTRRETFVLQQIRKRLISQ